MNNRRARFMQHEQKPVAGTLADAYHKIRVQYRPAEHGVFTAELFDYVENPNQMADIIEALSVMEKDDVFELRLSSGGGCLSTTDTLITAIRRCKGTVRMSASGNCASAATLILLEAHEFEISDNATFLIHCGSIGEQGTLAEFSKAAPFYTNWMQNFLRNSYAGFLTEEEIEQLLDGKDFLLTGEDWMERSEKRNEWMQAQMDKIIKAAEDSNKPKKPRKPRVKKEPVSQLIPTEPIAVEPVKV